MNALRLLLPPLLGVLLFFILPESMPVAARFTAMCVLWMAGWWMTEAAPVAATAFLPLVLFPLLDISNIRTVAGSYAHPIIFLFMGGFILALGISKWDLHRRIALFILLRVGNSGGALMAGFMLIAAGLSMWVSNTATTLMLVPIGLAIIDMVESAVSDIGDTDRRNFQTGLLLSIAYAATIGGVSTLIGTPPNAFMAAFMLEQYKLEIGFLQWMMVGVPVTLLMLPPVWLLLSRFIFPFRLNTTARTRDLLMDMQRQLGPMSREEKSVTAIFIVTALCWLFRPLLDDVLHGLSDSGIAMTSALVLFLLPARDGQRLLVWRDTLNLPWGILVLFGGGLALAAAIGSSGLATTIGDLFSRASGMGLVTLMVLMVTFVILLTETNGNLATVATFLPVVAAVALALDHPALLLVVPVTLAASCAFMLPIATPPNAIVYSAEKITIPQMMKAGFAINLLAIGTISLIATLLVPLVFLTVY